MIGKHQELFVTFLLSQVQHHAGQASITSTNTPDPARPAIETKLFATSVPNCPNPIAVFMAGGAGSGKTSAGQAHWKPTLDASPCGYAYINYDDIITELPEWPPDPRTRSRCIGFKIGFPRVSIMVDAFLKRAVDESRSFVWDGTMTNMANVQDLAKDLASKQYQVMVVAVTSDINTAADRAWTRSIEVGKQFNKLCMIFDSNVKFAAYFPTFAQMFPNTKLIDNNGAPGTDTVIFDKGVILDQIAFNRFQSKLRFTPAELESKMNQAALAWFKSMNTECGTCGGDANILRFDPNVLAKLTARSCNYLACADSLEESTCRIYNASAGCSRAPGLAYGRCQKTCGNCSCNSCSDTVLQNICTRPELCAMDVIQEYCPRMCGRCYSTSYTKAA